MLSLGIQSCECKHCHSDYQGESQFRTVVFLLFSGVDGGLPEKLSGDRVSILNSVTGHGDKKCCAPFQEHMVHTHLSRTHLSF